eukprot:COSAG06_NODE_518_length_14769_cov_75.390048_3_plen_400_part_00
MPSGWKKNAAGLSKAERLGGGDGRSEMKRLEWKYQLKREGQRLGQKQRAHDVAYAIRSEIDDARRHSLGASRHTDKLRGGVQRPVTEARGYRIIQPHHKTWVKTSEIPNSTPQRPSGGSVSRLHSASDTAERPLEEELAAERQRTLEAALERQRCEQQDRKLELELGPVVMQKRSLLASGTVDTSVSAQGVCVVAFPTTLEKAALVQTLRRCRDDGGTPSAEPGLSQAKESQTWPTSVDKQLLALSSKKLKEREPLAALVLARWATVGFDPGFDPTCGRPLQSLAHTKPRLAEKLHQVELVATRWLFKHAAYLPLLRDATLYANRYVDWDLHVTQRRLALATSFIPRLVKPALGNDHGSPLGLLDHDALKRVVAYFRATEQAIALSTHMRYVPQWRQQR